MIILYHNKYKVTKVFSTEKCSFPNEINRNIVAVLLDFADTFKDEILVWCHEREKENLNSTDIEKLFHHNKLLFSYNSAINSYLGRLVGYIEDTPYIKINKEVKYATWQMSSQVGAVHASVINSCKKDLKVEFNFDYFLNSFARRAMINGLFCYSEPNLLLQKNNSYHSQKSNLFAFFKFTKQHYKMRWIFVLFFNLMFYEKRFPIIPLLFSLFYKRRNLDSVLLDKIPIKSNKRIINQGTIDVLIPTIGRKEYLLDVLNNLESQTCVPANVIIVEQNPNNNSKSELDFIQNKKWSFNIKHHFTHQTGACNARNIGLSLIESEFVFLADDDIVFDGNLLETALNTFQLLGNEAFLVACVLKTQTALSNPPRQFAIFGAGHAFVKSSSLKGLKFNMGYEFGFGEDNDFGMQLRNKGFDILYISTSVITHLKAPIGGFRIKPVLRWEKDQTQPKPSPTLMLFRLLYDTNEQLRNYKTGLFFKNLNSSFFKNPFRHIQKFKQKWNRSMYWANELKKE
jgi:glycosyltransferase involved in cell wall biosynthesis